MLPVSKYELGMNPAYELRNIRCHQANIGVLKGSNICDVFCYLHDDLQEHTHYVWSLRLPKEAYLFSIPCGKLELSAPPFVCPDLFDNMLAKDRHS
jgi:hypothetical protein